MSIRRIPRFLVLAALLGAILVLAQCRRKGSVIPPDDMAEIYADMMVMDQWIKLNHMTREADTSLVYLPIIEKHGYDMEDWLVSVQKYSSVPEKYSKIFDRTQKILNRHIDSLERVEAAIRRRDSIARVRAAYKIPKFESYDSMIPSRRDRDTITFVRDSLGRWVLGDATRDTTFSGPLLVIKPRPDSLESARADSLRAAVDSLSGVSHNARGTLDDGKESLPKLDPGKLPSPAKDKDDTRGKKASAKLPIRRSAPVRQEVVISTEKEENDILQ